MARRKSGGPGDDFLNVGDGLYTWYTMRNGGIVRDDDGGTTEV